MDGGRVWAVDAQGTLGYVVDPVRAVEGLGFADQSSTPDYAVRAAFRDALEAFADSVDAYRAGVV
ncbi:hypothetical protein ACFVDQ_43040 [Streptomyces sp. NPDC057684]|uniref:hypothetical protein n=1 Tax=unclassified Streptomyces TaxID=2593676 RepID=UPI0036AAFC86